MYNKIQKSKKFNSRGIGTLLSQLIIIATSIYKKDQWKKIINELFSKPCYSDFKRIFEYYVTKGNG